MAAPNVKWLAIPLLASCGQLSVANPLTIENNLASCLTVEKATLQRVEGYAIANLSFKLTQSTAACGCKSRLNDYTVVAQYADWQRVVMQGKVALNDKGQQSIPVSADYALVENQPLTMTIGCAEAD
ncbi:DUF2195 family protein [Simiduia sp. 21SJ11W-1]|uniref:DUF2195 family protein n=1 Tax=Simiduia sp. 21SJ11W-1 TaxID=2909669 RepID=UPI00209FD2DF|nr:DUF2195 family protein [Simiduia sp. 21SJ11W-1]UTA47079.1 DUF2195 family protein [Simiduia sp. 21SJ11W-1]